jgi:hypothetical protein
MKGMVARFTHRLTLEEEARLAALTEVQLAYIAGLIDGEGSLESQRQFPRTAANPRFVLRLSFTLGTSEPVTTVGTWLGCPPKRYPPVDETRQPRWRLNLPRKIAVPLLERCLPYLILKRQQAELVLAIESVRATNSPPREHVGHAKLLRMPAPAVAEMERLHGELRSLKSNKRPAHLRS